MASDSVFYILIVGLIFWLVLPFPAMFFGVTPSGSIDSQYIEKNIDSKTNVNVISQAGIIFSGIGLYFKLLFMTWAGVPMIISIILLGFKLINLLAFILVLKT